MSEKKSLEEQVSKLTLAGSSWIEPMRNWIKQAVSLREIAKSSDLLAKKTQSKEIFGLNLILKNKKAQPPAAQKVSPPSENIWFLLRKTKEKTARMGDNSDFSRFVVPLYDKARTHFMRES